MGVNFNTATKSQNGVKIETNHSHHDNKSRQPQQHPYAKSSILMEQTACEDVIADLKAFERRLTEVIAHLQPSTIRWRIVLLVVSICVATGAGQWLMDPITRIVPLSQSLMNHPFFLLATIMLIIIFMLGVHRRVVASSIITSRAREVLCHFNMSCDDTGKLILKPRPTNIT